MITSTPNKRFPAQKKEQPYQKRRRESSKVIWSQSGISLLRDHDVGNLEDIVLGGGRIGNVPGPGDADVFVSSTLSISWSFP